MTGVPANRALSIVVAGDDGKAAMRGWATPARPGRSATTAPAARSRSPIPTTGVSFCWFTNGLDRHLLRQWRRTAGIASKAGAVVPASKGR